MCVFFIYKKEEKERKGVVFMADHNSGAFSGRIAKMDVKRLQSKSEKSGTVALANVTLAVNYYSRKEGGCQGGAGE